MTQEINRQELTKQLRRLFGFQGSTAFELGETVLAVASLGDLDAPPFHSKIGGVGSVVQAPIAGQSSYAGLRCPLTAEKNFIAVVRYMTLAAAGAMEVLIRPLPTVIVDATLAPVLVAPLTSWDTVPARVAGDIVRSQMQTLSAANAAGVLARTESLSVTLQAGVTFPLKRNWVLHPGNTLLVNALLVNTGMTVGFYWDEYYVG